MDKYAPTAFAHLLSEEAINREVSPSSAHTHRAAQQTLLQDTAAELVCFNPRDGVWNAKELWSRCSVCVLFFSGTP